MGTEPFEEGWWIIGNPGGQVLVIADLGLLQADSTVEKNLEFLKNIARYARECPETERMEP